MLDSSCFIQIFQNKPVGSKIEDGTIHVTDVDQGDNADTRITCFSESTANQVGLSPNSVLQH